MAMQSTNRVLDLQYFYTPRFIFTACKGITVQVSTSKFDGPLNFLFAPGPNKPRFYSAHTGLDGMRDLRRQLESSGYTLPKEFGNCVPFEAPNVKILAKSICVRLRDPITEEGHRLYFKFDRTYGSFNSAAHSAFKALNLHKRMRELVKIQGDIIRHADSFSDAPPDMMHRYLNLIGQ